MTTEMQQTYNFITQTKGEIEEQTFDLQEELKRKLYNSDYHRESVLAGIFINHAARPLPPRNNVSKDDLAYSAWVIGELKGRLQAQKAHREMQQLTPMATAYDNALHIRIVSALRAELQILAEMLEVYALAQPTEAGVIQNLQKRSTETSRKNRPEAAGPVPLASQGKPKVLSQPHASAPAPRYRFPIDPDDRNINKDTIEQSLE